MKLHYTLKKSDVGQPIIRAFGQIWVVTNFIGHIFPSDVGKRVYIIKDTQEFGILQVENDKQRDSRA